MPAIDVDPAGDLDATRIRVYDSRRKQKWFDPSPSIMDTPLGSPEHTPQNLIPEPLLQDILELISESDIDDRSEHKDSDISLDTALNELGLSRDDIGSLCDEESYYREGDDEQLRYLDTLLQETIEMEVTENDTSSNYLLDNTPPPTNPPSPPEPSSEDDEEDVPEMYINIENSPSKTLKKAKSILEETIVIKKEPVAAAVIEEHVYEHELFPEFRERKRSSSETIKHDCMWNGICCSKNEDFGLDDFLEFGKGTSFELFDNFEETVVKRRRKSSEVQIEESEVECEVDVDVDVEVDDGEVKVKLEVDDQFELNSIRSACNNDHSYALPHSAEEDADCSNTDASSNSTTSSPVKKINFLNIKKKSSLKGIVIKEEAEENDSLFYSNSHNNQSSSQHQPKKTKILVPLKDLMATLQQKSFLVAPLGPGKKVIRLTGTETVKGVLGMSPPVTSSSSSSSCSTGIATSGTTITNPPKKNVRKRPHPPNPPTPPMFPAQQPTLPTTPPTAPPKKKTKAHNNMERMRRIDLRNSFDNLKKLVPPLSKANKCSKVEILRRAEEYIRALRSLEKRLVKEELSVKCKNDSLRVRLAQLDPKKLEKSID